MKIFLSYHFHKNDENHLHDMLVHRVCYYLNKQPNLNAFSFPRSTNEEDWQLMVDDQISLSNFLVFFISDEIGDTQFQELMKFTEKHKLDDNDKKTNFYFIMLKDVLSENDKKIFKDCINISTFEQCSKNIKSFDILIKYDKIFSELDFKQNQYIFETLTQKLSLSIIQYIKPNSDLSLLVDGLPLGYPFEYEKDIIKNFVQGSGYLTTDQKLKLGCPISWPTVKRIKSNNCYPNKISQQDIGSFREPEDKVIVDVLNKYHQTTQENHSSNCLNKIGLKFPEAGPREKLLLANNDNTNLNIGIVVSGGIAPGINAVITGIINRHILYSGYENTERNHVPRYNLNIILFRNGLSGIVENHHEAYNFVNQDSPTKIKENENNIEMIRRSIFDYRNRGGSVISTSRFDELLDIRDKEKRDEKLMKIVKNIKDVHHLQVLYVIGGEGSMRAAHAISEISHLTNKNFSVVAIPKTMDNDILWAWQSFGFLSAVEKAKEFLQHLHTECKSNPRLCVVQLFGSDSGFVVSHTVLGSGVCMAALIPEVKYTLKGLSSYVISKFNKNNLSDSSPFGIIALAETAVPFDIEDYIENEEYPEVTLEKEEIKEIRRFVGSALINYEDVNQNIIIGGKASFHDKIKDLLSLFKNADDLIDVTELKFILESKLQVEQKVSIICKLLNKMIKNGSIKNLKKDSPEIETYHALLGKSFSFAENCENKDTLKRLFSLPLQHDAKDIVQAIFNHKYQKNENTRDMLDDYIDISGDKRYKILQKEWPVKLKKRMIELRNRKIIDEKLSDYVRNREEIVLSERRVMGQTPDKLRTGTLKVITQVLQHDIRKIDIEQAFWSNYRVFTSEPRHLIRAIDPSAQDVIFAQRIGTLAVDNAMAGYTDFMVSQWLTEFVLVPLELVVLGRKRVPPEGIFWRSVLASTGQPPFMW
ncbi:MAG: 6-phosphofructokinase [Candidatus Cloacimonetes bacterium]|nr:6-phosphofructokinase [Candidatus Cloacimonadota bacterium]